MAAFAVIVHEMLGRSHDTALFQGFHISDAETGVHQYVLPIAFLAASPALVAGDVDDRGIDLTDTDGTELLRNHLAFPVIQVVVESGRHADALRETGRVPPLGTVQGLAVLEHRNAPPARLDGLPRIFIDPLGHGFRIVGKPAVREEMADIPYMAFRIIPSFIEFIHEQELGAHLSHFFLKTHPGQKVLHALLHRKLRIRVTRFFRTAPQEEREQGKDA